MEKKKVILFLTGFLLMIVAGYATGYYGFRYLGEVGTPIVAAGMGMLIAYIFWR